MKPIFLPLLLISQKTTRTNAEIVCELPKTMLNAMGCSVQALGRSLWQVLDPSFTACPPPVHTTVCWRLPFCPLTSLWLFPSSSSVVCLEWIALAGPHGRTSLCAFFHGGLNLSSFLLLDYQNVLQDDSLIVLCHPTVTLCHVSP